MNKYFYRIINTVITAAGTIICIVSGFIPAPNGLLSDGTISLIQALPGSKKVLMFLIPVLLMIAATVMVGAGRYRMLSMIAVLTAACLFSWTDLSYINASMAFTGTLLNEMGVVIVLSGALLHAIGTPKSEEPEDESAESEGNAKSGSKVKVEGKEKSDGTQQSKKRMETDSFIRLLDEATYEEEVLGGQAGFYGPPEAPLENTVVMSPREEPPERIVIKSPPEASLENTVVLNGNVADMSVSEEWETESES